MTKPRNMQMADIPPDGGNPLDAAVAGRNRSILTQVAAAVRHNELRLAFQPVVHAQSHGIVAFYEGLMRVLDDTGRVIPAGDFMPLVEREELGREIDCAALQAGLKTLKQYPDVTISVNVSGRSVGYRKWLRILDRVLKNHPDLGERLFLELSEDGVMAVPDLLPEFMQDLRQKGVRFVLDDFGSGDIALRHFRKFRFDAVKIDGQFIRGVHANRENQKLVAALIGVAHEFGYFTVAESVETQSEVDALISLGVDCMQGFFFCAPTLSPPWVADETVIV